MQFGGLREMEVGGNLSGGLTRGRRAMTELLELGVGVVSWPGRSRRSIPGIPSTLDQLLVILERRSGPECLADGYDGVIPYDGIPFYVEYIVHVHVATRIVIGPSVLCTGNTTRRLKLTTSSNRFSLDPVNLA